MNATTLVFPWSGMPTGPATAAVGVAGGGAPTPVPNGSGFNWASMAQGMVGGPVSRYLQTVQGRPVNATFVQRYRGLRGLGQDGGDYSAAVDAINAPIDYGSTSTTTLSLPGFDTSLPNATGGGYSPTSTPASSGSGFNLSNFLTTLITSGTKVGQQVISYQNPLLQKGTYYQTPQGAVYASDVSSAIPGLNANLTSSSMLPILLIGGVVLVLMLAKK